MRRPTPWQKVVKKIAQQLNLPEQEVKEIVLWYWKHYRKEMGNLERTKVLIPGFGTFHLKPWRMEQELEDLRRKIKKTQNHGGSLRKWKACERYRADFRKIASAKKVLDEEYKRKVKIRVTQKKMQQEYYPEYLKKLKERGVDEKIIESLEKQATNMGGNSEQLGTQSESGKDCSEKIGDLSSQ